MGNRLDSSLWWTRNRTGHQVLGQHSQGIRYVTQYHLVLCGISLSLQLPRHAGICDGQLHRAVGNIHVQPARQHQAKSPRRRPR